MVIEEILEHFGTKGMKWGVRKNNVAKQGPADDAKGAHKAFVKAKVSGVEALSNKELSTLNNRLNLEQNFQRLSYNPSKLQKGLTAVGGILKSGNTLNDAVKFANSPVGIEMAAGLGSKTAKATKAANQAKKVVT